MLNNDQIPVRTLKMYTRIPHGHRNEILNPYKTSSPLKHVLGIIT